VFNIDAYDALSDAEKRMRLTVPLNEALDTILANYGELLGAWIPCWKKKAGKKLCSRPMLAEFKAKTAGPCTLKLGSKNWKPKRIPGQRAYDLVSKHSRKNARLTKPHRLKRACFQALFVSNTSLPLFEKEKQSSGSSPCSEDGSLCSAYRQRALRLETCLPLSPELPSSC